MARDHADYYYVKWTAYAVINDERVEIQGFEIDYPLDEIPEAKIYPVVGLEPTSGIEAKAFQVILDAQPYSVVQIFVKGAVSETDSPRGNDFPGLPFDEDVLVFDGIYTGVGYRSGRSPAGGGVQIYGGVAHWLTGFMGSSTQNVGTTVKGPGGFAEIANTGLPGANNEFALFDTRNAFVRGPEDAVSNLWKEFIKPMFQAIVDSPSVWGGEDNKSANDALAKMDLEAAFPSGIAENDLPLRVGNANVPDEVLGAFIGYGVGKLIYKLWRNANLWTALKVMADQFLFKIVPLIETATCAPVFGALGGDPYVIIEPDEYYDINLVAQTPALVTKLVLTGSVGTNTSPYSPTPRENAVIGIASSEEAWAGPLFPVRGMTVQREAPPWLEAEVPIGKITRLSVGGDRFGIPDAVNPDAFSAAPEQDYQEIYNNYVTSDMGDRYAEALLKNLMLEPRNGKVWGRFRLDVAPGSTIAVTLIGNKFSEANAEPNFIFGLVNNVHIEMHAGKDGATGHAFTQFDLTHVRTGVEQTGFGSFIVADTHPLYESRFVGTKLFVD